jgi:hypothetical protein
VIPEGLDAVAENWDYINLPQHSSCLPVQRATVLVNKGRSDAVDAFQSRMAPEQLHVARHIIIGTQSASRVTEIYGSVFLAGSGLDLYVVNIKRDIKELNEILR